MSVFSFLFSDEFMPHGMCYLWKPELLWLHVASDALIFVAYVSIPLTLTYILKQRSDLIFSKIMGLFIAFVLLCGFTHAIAVWTVWNGTYWFSGSIKGITALVSIATAFMLWKLVPVLKSIPTVEKLKIEVGKRVAAEKELNEQASKLTLESGRLSRSNDELKAFAYASSHDLKSPLRGIRQLASWIEEDLQNSKVELSADTKENFSLMQSRVVRMENLLDDLFTYSKVGRLEVTTSSVDCKKLCSELFDMLADQSVLELHLDSQLPTFNTHETPFAQVIRNLFDNAIKHNDTNKGIIWVKARDIGDFYEFTIEDNGPGVAPEHFDKIVNIFTTLKSKDDMEGSGMGLAIIAKIIKNYHGELKFKTRSGNGLCVIFTWPKIDKLNLICGNKVELNA